jgi:hypothetical protein
VQTQGVTDVQMHVRVCSHMKRQIFPSHIFHNKDTRYVHMDASNSHACVATRMRMHLPTRTSLTSH